MNVFEKVKETVTTKQVAEYYGFYVNRHGMTTCPFHKDRVPSMKHDYIEYLLNIMIYGSLEDRKALVAEQRNEVKNLERRFADISERGTEKAVGDDAKGQARKYSQQLQGSISERSSA